jgi:hypothetical protein
MWQRILAKVDALRNPPGEDEIKNSNLLIHGPKGGPLTFSLLSDQDFGRAFGPAEYAVVVVNLTIASSAEGLAKLAVLGPNCLVHRANQDQFVAVAPIFKDCEVRFYTTGAGTEYEAWAAFLKELGVPDDRALSIAMHEFKRTFSWLVLSIKNDPTGREARELLALETVPAFLLRAGQAHRKLLEVGILSLSEPEALELEAKSELVMNGIETVFPVESHTSERDWATLAFQITDWVDLYERVALRHG